MIPLSPLLVAMLLAVPPAQPPGTRPAGVVNGERAHQPPETADALRAEVREDIERLKARYPALEPGKLSDLLTARMHEGFLLVELRQAPQQWPVLLPLKDDPDALAQINITRRQQLLSDQESPPTTRFSLMLNRPGEAGSDIVQTHAQITAGPLPGQLNMSFQRVWMDGSEIHVQYIQLLAGLADGPDARLHLSRLTMAPEVQNEHDMYEAGSFNELARREPEIFEQYVRPMLRELEIEAVLEGDTRQVATQALLRELPVDDATLKKVDQLLAQLDSPDFNQREEAEAQLEQLGRPAASALAKVAEDRQLSLEQQTRVRSVLQPYEAVDPDALAPRLADPEFWRAVAALSGGPEDELLAEHARRRLREMGEPEGPATRPSEAGGVER